MNIMNMMQNVQKMQKRLMETQKELENVEVAAQSAGGAVEVVYTGQAKFKRIKIKPEAINPENPDSVDTETIEMLDRAYPLIAAHLSGSVPIRRDQ